MCSRWVYSHGCFEVKVEEFSSICFNHKWESSFSDPVGAQPYEIKYDMTSFN
jgi:hypothetical protein